jgi:large subunit ribosomal protein L21
MVTFAVPKLACSGLKSENRKVYPPDRHNFKKIRMYAIVEIAGQQFKVEKNKKVFVHRLQAEVDDPVEFSKVLLVDDDGNVKIGTPVVEGAKVTARVLEHTKGKKVLVFKKKRRKGYQKMNGHRQCFTQILIEDIVGSF